MSAPGPESIPVSADRRSKRPIKKRAVTPVSAQAASVEALFAKPEQEIRLPPTVGSAVPRRLAPPPEIVTNVQGSSAGAGSGEFHVYKASRRREYERLRLMDDEVRQEQAAADFEIAKHARETKDEEKTRKNREKREKKMKARLKAKGDTSEGLSQTAPGSGKLQPRRDGNNEGSSTMDQNEGHGQAPSTAAGSSTDMPGILIHDDD